MQESEEEEAAVLFDEFIKPTFLNHQKLKQAQYQSSSGRTYSSSFSSNVPSPAPNGQVPSPAPPEGATTSLASDNKVVSSENQVGGGTIKSTNHQAGPLNPLNQVRQQTICMQTNFFLSVSFEIVSK